MRRTPSTRHCDRSFRLPLRATVLVLLAALPSFAGEGTLSPSPYWKNDVAFPYDSFCNSGFSKDSVKWIKFTILREPYDPSLVYFQDSRKYVFHYNFAAEVLDPFRGMTTQQFNAVTLSARDAKAVLGTVILPPAAVWPTAPKFLEYGIQFVRQEAFTPEEIRDLFHIVKAAVAAPPEVQAFYFPTYEQQAAATACADWLLSQGIPVGSTARWAPGNVCYSPGWAFGTLRFFPGDRIAAAYHSGGLSPGDILLTDGVPAEVPFVAGIISLAPSTPNSHVAILARTYGVPFAYLALAADAQRARGLLDHRIAFCAYESADGSCEVKLVDTDDTMDAEAAAQILELKRPAALQISPMASLGALGVSTEGLSTSDIRYVGGKAANFSLLRAAVPENSPQAMALTFDLWNAFLGQPLTAAPALCLSPGEHMLFWADGDSDRGPAHTNFRLSKDGESLGLFDVDGVTPIDSVSFGRQSGDVSYGRSTDAGDTWQMLPDPTPGSRNSAGQGQIGYGLVINEIMADNERTIQDPSGSGEYPDWIELYNASDHVVTLNGLYLTDDMGDPTQWQVPPEIVAPTLREEIAQRLSKYESYPPPDMQMLSRDLAAIRSLFTNAGVTTFSDDLREAVIGVLTDPAHGLDAGAMLRFRSSTNVEDSMDFIGAGLYDSYSGCLADALDGDDDGPCACDPNRKSERDLFHAIRQVFASFYNTNAYLERLRHEVNEAEAGMAVVVHHSFPDEIELANGVATVERRGADTNTGIRLVTQQGAVSVTNPEDGSIPEEVTMTVLASGGIMPLLPKDIRQASTLVPLGGKVLTWTSDYLALADLLVRISEEFARTTGRTTYVLDLEYKKVAPGSRVLPAGGLVIKQVREIPSSDRTQTAFLLNEPTRFEVFPGEILEFEATDVFADHRLKSRWTLETRSMVLDANTLAEGLYTQVQIEYLDDDQVRTISGRMDLLPSSEHGFDGRDAVDCWRLDGIENPRTYRLTTPGIPTAVPAGQRPLLTVADLGAQGYNVPFRCLRLNVRYDQPVLSWRQSMSPSGAVVGSPGLRMTQENRVDLWRLTPPSANDIRQERTVSIDGISVKTSFYYPPLPPGQDMWGFLGGNTGPLKRWEQTVIEGLTATPIVLKGYYSQTFRPQHHNLVELFLFEPRLEPDISPEVLAELKQKGIRFIQVILDHTDTSASQILTHGFDAPPQS